MMWTTAFGAHPNRAGQGYEAAARQEMPLEMMQKAIEARIAAKCSEIRKSEMAIEALAQRKEAADSPSVLESLHALAPAQAGTEALMLENIAGQEALPSSTQANESQLHPFNFPFVGCMGSVGPQILAMQTLDEYASPQSPSAQASTCTALVPFSGSASPSMTLTAFSGSALPPLGRDGEFTGTILRIKGSYGFIKQDVDGAEMFVMPNACKAFGEGQIPPVGTRVCYDVVTDAKTGRPRAENCQPAPPCGTIRIIKDGGKYGFITQDGSGEDMFIMPKACNAFGNVIPDVGTRVRFFIVTDAKTGRPRAEHVRPEPSAASDAMVAMEGMSSGTGMDTGFESMNGVGSCTEIDPGFEWLTAKAAVFGKVAGKGIDNRSTPY